MLDIELLGNKIKEKRISLNLRMDDVARQANITRTTLWEIEKGVSNCSVRTLVAILDILGLNLSINEDNKVMEINRTRASRKNTILEKKINGFIVMCVEQYAKAVNKNSKDVYKDLLDNGVITELHDDYEDLHGMSSVWINDYINHLLGENCLILHNDSTNEVMDHTLSKTLIIKKVIELIASKYRVSLEESRNMFYSSNTIELLEDDETGLYGESPLYVFSLFEEEIKQNTK